MRISGIYKITSPNNRIYIGLSSSIYHRWENYKQLSNSKSQKLLHRSFKKYGIKNHKFEIIEECCQEKLSEREIYWIDKLKSYHYIYKKGLNMTKGGEIPPKQTKPKSKEHKLKISLGRKGIYHSEETKQKIRESRNKQKFTIESIQKASKSRMKKCKLINKFTHKEWKSDSIKELVLICPISQAMIYKLKKKESKQYKFIYE